MDGRGKFEMRGSRTGEGVDPLLLGILPDLTDPALFALTPFFFPHFASELLQGRICNYISRASACLSALFFRAKMYRISQNFDAHKGSICKSVRPQSLDLGELFLGRMGPT